MLWKRYSAQLSELKGRELQRDQTSPSRGMVVQLLLPQGCHKSAAAAVCLSPWLMQRSFTGADFVQLWFCWHTPSCSFFARVWKKIPQRLYPVRSKTAYLRFSYPGFCAGDWYPSCCFRVLDCFMVVSSWVQKETIFLSTFQHLILFRCLSAYLKRVNPLLQFV